MGGAQTIPKRTVVPKNLTRICVSGYYFSHHTSWARKIADELLHQHPNTYETWYHFVGFKEYKSFLNTIKKEFPENHPLSSHTTSPFCWLEKENEFIPIGGRDRLSEWVATNYPDASGKLKQLIETKSPPLLSAIVKKTPGTSQQ